MSYLRIVQVVCALVGLSALTSAQFIPVPMELQNRILYHNGYDHESCVHDGKGVGIVRTNKATITKDGLIGNCISFAPKSIGWHLKGDSVAAHLGRTFSVWFKVASPLRHDQLWLTLLTNDLPAPKLTKSGWITLAIWNRVDRWSHKKVASLFTQAYHLAGNPNFHACPLPEAQEVFLPDTWHHAAMTCNGKTITWYLDGKLLKQHTLGSILPHKRHATPSICFGRTLGITAAFDEFTVFDGVLDKDTIQDYYQQIQMVLMRRKLLND